MSAKSPLALLRHRLTSSLRHAEQQAAKLASYERRLEARGRVKAYRAALWQLSIAERKINR